MRALWLGVVIAALAACEPPSTEDELEIVSETLCRCATFSPGEDSACVAKLEAEIVVTDQCVQCVEQEAGDCSTDVLCAFSCVQQGSAVPDRVPTKENP